MKNITYLNKSKTYQITSIALMATILCVLGPLSIPIGIIPVSFTNLAIYITLYVLGRKKATISLSLYLLLGLIGLPVFSSFRSGFATLLGPTGGYLIGFIFMTIISGFFIDKYYNFPFICILGMILGTSTCYLFGSLWLSYQSNITFKAALDLGVILFIPADLVKIIISAFLGPKIYKRLNNTNTAL